MTMIDMEWCLIEARRGDDRHGSDPAVKALSDEEAHMEDGIGNDPTVEADEILERDTTKRDEDGIDGIGRYLSYFVLI